MALKNEIRSKGIACQPRNKNIMSVTSTQGVWNAVTQCTGDLISVDRLMVGALAEDFRCDMGAFVIWGRFRKNKGKRQAC